MAGHGTPAAPTTPQGYDAAAIAELLFMIEEEKLAGDIYEAFYAMYGVVIFDNIAGSEDRHFATLLAHAEAEGLDLSAILAEPAGSYVDADLQALYDALLAQGGASEAAALDVGRLIEETDIVDLREAAALVPETPLYVAYMSLLAGSENHLAAFNTALANADPLPEPAPDPLPVPSPVPGTDGDDTIDGTDGRDTISGGEGNDRLSGGISEGDLRDLIMGGAGDDLIDGGYGNDELRGDDGNDTIAGGFGADLIVGGGNDDVLSGEALSDEIHGGDGNDLLNGGFGYDRLNGGAGADRFYHLGVEGHGTDWIQDFTAADGDVLVFGGTGAGVDDFLVQFAETANAGAAGVAEAFVTYIPTGQILWALIDGAGQDQIDIVLDGATYDLLA